MAKTIEIGKFEEFRNGIPLKYKIQTISPDLIEDVIQHMFAYFLTREPLTTYDRLIEDKISSNSYKNFWRKVMLSGESMIALEERTDYTVNILGVNLTKVAEKGKKDDEKYEGEVFDKVLTAMVDLMQRGNIYEKYQIDKYLAAFGLSVHPDYHGYNIGYNLLKSRELLSKILGVKATATVFSAKSSQYIAEKAGFEVIVEESYETFKVHGVIAYPGLDGVINYMGKRYHF